MLLANFGYGFAAGCEATALPRRKLLLPIWAVPLVRARLPALLWHTHFGLSPDQGHSPNSTGIVTARQSRRLTSGGEAVLNSYSSASSLAAILNE